MRLDKVGTLRQTQPSKLVVKSASCILPCVVQVQQLRDMGKDPYAYKFDKTHTVAQLHEQHRDLPAGQLAEGSAPVQVAGRVRARRFMGKLAFATLADDSGEIQLYLERTALNEAAPDSFKYVLHTVPVTACINTGSAPVLACPHLGCMA